MIRKKKCQIKFNHPSGKHHRRYISLINMIKEFQFQKVELKRAVSVAREDGCVEKR